jgi:hypothetical protein
MDWLQILVLLGGNLAFILPLWLWNRSESRADIRRCEDLILTIHAEIKDFHGRLCAIEERYRK